MRIFERVGKDLLHHKRQPFLVRHRPDLKRFHLKRKAAAQKKDRIFAHRLLYDLLHVTVPEKQIRGQAVQSGKIKGHFRILLDLEKLLPLRLPSAVPRAFFCLFLLLKQPQRRNGRLDLMCPHGIVVRHVLLFSVVFRLQPAILLPHVLQHLLIQNFLQSRCLRQTLLPLFPALQ